MRVLNATDREGEANRVADALKELGFQVAEVDNDRSGRKVTGVGEVRHGPRGKDAAEYMGVYLPGAADYTTPGPTSMIDLVIGPEY